MIRYHVEQIVYHNPKALIVRLIRDYAEGFVETKDKTVAFAEDPNKVLHALL